MTEKRSSTTQRLFQEMLDRICSGQWPIGSAIPSQRTLVEQFGVSRFPLREALSMLRALGVLEISHGRSTTVRRMDAEILGQLFPLMLRFEGEQTFEQVFEVRLAIESRTAYSAAQRRSEEDIQRLNELLRQHRAQIDGELEQTVQTDLDFHLQIARAANNPLFPWLITALSGFVHAVQINSCKDDALKRQRALQYHECIAEAIAYRDAERARAEMESHLYYSAERVLRDGTLRTEALGSSEPNLSDHREMSPVLRTSRSDLPQ